MTDLTTAEKTRLRRRIGDINSAYTDPTLQDAFDEAEGDLGAATVICFEWLLAGAIPLTDQKLGLTEEKKSQIFDHIAYVLLPHWRDKLTSSNQVKIVGTRQVPPRSKDAPWGNRTARSGRLNRRFGTDLDEE
jgi:hypothetical protein